MPTAELDQVCMDAAHIARMERYLRRALGTDSLELSRRSTPESETFVGAGDAIEAFVNGRSIGMIYQATPRAGAHHILMVPMIEEDLAED